ncbi:MAG: UDP-3-O-acyl-N-acetylglucosamine deacetylase [Acidobacteriota bacterium]
MAGRYQQTLARAVRIEGTGLHSAAGVRLKLLPAGADSGIIFERTDAAGVEIPASHAFLRSSRYATTLARDGVEVSTVEHLLSALSGLGVDNARIEIDGPEVPILDGSALPFVRAIRSAGLRRLGTPRRRLSLLRPISVRMGGKEILALPANEFEATYAIDFPHPAIGYQAVTTRITEERYADSIAAARTFCLLSEVEAMRRSGLARGGSLSNALVVGEVGVMNGTLRYRDEFVRHKVLDLIGDLALLGAPLRAHVIVFKGGHELHAALIARILRERSAWSLAASDRRLTPSQIARFAQISDRLVPRGVALTA